MIRNRHTGDIYLISLDTFMIMTIVGFVIGIILMVVNPLLNPTDRIDEVLFEEYTLSDRYAFEECLKNEFPNLKTLDYGELKISEKVRGYMVDVNFEIEGESVIIDLIILDEAVSTEEYIIDVVNNSPCLNQYLTDPRPCLDC